MGDLFVFSVILAANFLTLLRFDGKAMDGGGMFF